LKDRFTFGNCIKRTTVSQPKKISFAVISQPNIIKTHHHGRSNKDAAAERHYDGRKDMAWDESGR
jgi:hypothetical protein